MSEKSDPKTYFWPYDIFGYLLPGIIAIVPLIEFHAGVRSLVQLRYNAESIADNLVLLVAVYVVGHIISAASSFLLERCFLRLSFGYPVAQFLCGSNSGTIIRRTVMFVVNPARWGIVRWLPRRGRFSWIFSTLYSFGVWSERRLDLLPGFCHPFDPEIGKLVQTRFELRFGVQFRDWFVRRRTHEAYWTIWAYVAENMPTSYRTGMHFLELYGFCRNSCFAFLLAGLYPLCPDWGTTDASGRSLITPPIWSAGCCVCAVMLYINFTKLLRRQNDFVLRAFISERIKYQSSDSVKS
jgi:hypothetical protein